MPKKWDGDSTSSEKLLQLFATLLFNKRAFSLSELSSPAQLNASKPTVSRLLEKLERSGIGRLIREERGRETYFSLDHKSAQIPPISADDVAAIALCRDLVAHLLPERTRLETANIISRLGGRSGDARSPEAISLTRGRVDYAPYQEIFAALELAIRKKLVCQVSYLASANSKPREYPFAPLRLLCSQETIYIEGWILETENPAKRKYDDPSRLALHRFQSCELTEISSAKTPSLPPLKNDALGLLEQDPFEAKIHFAPTAANYVAERIWSKDQTIERREDGSIILTARMANFPEALAWVLSFGKSAVALEPSWFARAIREELRDAARNYRKKKEEENAEKSENKDSEDET
ncbi:MAG: WYL domain-containing protein [Desulfovibrio sp.]|nr:WYL domain-containing protein [Desulfovibrio sp.]